MEVVNFIDRARSLSAQYVDSFNVNITESNIAVEGGFNIYFAQALRGANDVKINNYSSLYLTNNKFGSDILSYNKITDTDPEIIVTYMAADLSSGLKYMYISPSESLSGDSGTRSISFKSLSEVPEDNTNKIYFEIELLDSRYCRILHRSQNDFFYLTVNDSLELFFSNVVGIDYTGYTLSIIDSNIFEYFLDAPGNAIALFKSLSSSLYSSTSSMHVSMTDDFNMVLSEVKTNTPIAFNSSNRFIIEYSNRIQQISPKLSTSWAAYKRNSNMLLDPTRSAASLPSNYIFSTQYSYITGNSVTYNLFDLKNHLSDTGRSLRGDYLTTSNNSLRPNVNMRNYEALHTGSIQEKGNEDMTLTYTMYNKDYTFRADEYTVFVTPASIYPFTRININDTLLSKSGAFAGDSPHTSDKIFAKIDENFTYGGKYLCTWLSGGGSNSTSLWVDRVYDPALTDVANALSGSSKTYYTFESPKNVVRRSDITDNHYYDVISSLSILPQSEYIYQRIGKTYVNNFIKHLDDVLIFDQIYPRSAGGGFIEYGNIDKDSIVYNMSDNYYTSDIGDRAAAKYTFCFWLEADDWSKKFGNSLAGSIVNQGIAIVNDDAITPFILIQSDDNVLVYNTSFKLVDTINFNGEYIKHIIRTSHLNSFYVTTTSNNIFKVQSNGPVFDKISIALVPDYVNYSNSNDSIYFITSAGESYRLNTSTESLELYSTVSIPTELDISHDINSIVVKSGNVYGFRGEKAIDSNSYESYFLINNCLIARERDDHSTRTILLTSSTAVRDFAIDQNQDFYIIHNTNQISKFTKERLAIYKSNISTNQTLSAIAVDIVREYGEIGLVQYPIILSHDDNNVLYLSKVNEDTLETTTVKLTQGHNKYQDPCDAVEYFYGTNGGSSDRINNKFNLTNFKFIKNTISDSSSLKFETKVTNNFNNRDLLDATIEYAISDLSPGRHFFAFRVDCASGNISVFVDGDLVENRIFEVGKYAIQPLITNGFHIGATGFYNNVLLSEYLKQPKYYFCKDIKLMQPRLFSDAIDDIDIKFIYLNNVPIGDLIASLPCGERNQLEQIQRMFKWQLPGSKSNYLNVKIKSNILSDESLNYTLKNEILREIRSILPATADIKSITFDKYS